MADSRSPVRVAIVGAAGRMGRALLRAAPQFPQLVVTGAVVSAASDVLGQDAGGIADGAAGALRFSADLPRALAGADVVIDFSAAAATGANLEACRSARKPLLLGTTGWPAELEERLRAAGREIPLLVAANTSIGVAVLSELVRAAARALPAEFDISIVEAHHRGKRDAPSGTAVALRQAALEGRAAAPAGRTGAAGTGPAVEIAAVRAGDIVGEHTVLMAGGGEQLLLGHRAQDRAIFARGALQGALWLAAQAPGRYAMGDFLGLKNSHLR